MTTDLVPYRPTDQPPALPPGGAAAELLADWLAGRSPATMRAYSNDLNHFARWLGRPSAAAAAAELLDLGHGTANAYALRYRNDQLAAGLASATIARRLASLRSLIDLARSLGRVSWSLDVRSPRLEPRRDVRGPDRDERRKLWRALTATGDGPRARRDRAAVALLFDLGLRRSEVVELDLGHVDLVAPSVAVRGKGRRERQPLALPPATVKALAEWIETRGPEPGPLFVRLDHPGPVSRLTGEGLARAVGRLGRAAKLPRPLRPHGLRHAAITAALDRGEDVRKVRLFSRHGKIETVIRYDDARDDVAARIAKEGSRERK